MAALTWKRRPAQQISGSIYLEETSCTADRWQHLPGGDVLGGSTYLEETSCTADRWQHLPGGDVLHSR